jgi:medium-chain acyl-[acyl-carrier-protein] hydrolase
MTPTKKTYTFEISPQSVDFNYRITLSSLTDLLLTAAGYNAEENGFGMKRLNDQGLSWVLLRFAL